MNQLPRHCLPFASHLLAVTLATTTLALTQCHSQSEGTAEASAQMQAARPSPAYNAEEDVVYSHVLPHLLQQSYWEDIQRLRSADGSLLIPAPPPSCTTQAQQWAYYQAYVASHPGVAAAPFVLNLAPTLRSLPAFLAGNGGFLSDTAHQAYFHALQALQRRAPAFAALTDRSYQPEIPPPVWKYGLYWRYEPFRQYADPEGTVGRQRGLQLSRVCFNAARDSAFFVYDVDYYQYVLGGVGLVCKRQGRWALQEQRKTVAAKGR
jgi:hypothetical protein